MIRIAGTAIAFLFLLWGILALVGGAGAGRGDWIFLGAVLAAFGAVFVPAIRYLWQRDGS